MKAMLQHVMFCRSPAWETVTPARKTLLSRVTAIGERADRARLGRRRRRLMFTDGPFTETKELTAGYQPPNAQRR